MFGKKVTFLPTESSNYNATTCDCFKDRWRCNNVAACPGHVTFEYTAVVLSVIELTFTVKLYCFGRPCRHFVSVEEGNSESVIFNGFFHFLFMCKVIFLFVLFILDNSVLTVV